jgi:hypothetical protein
MLSIIYAECHKKVFVIMLNVIELIVMMLNVIMVSVIVMNIIRLSVIMLNANILNVVMLIVAVPFVMDKETELEKTSLSRAGVRLLTF